MHIFNKLQTNTEENQWQPLHARRKKKKKKIPPLISVRTCITSFLNMKSAHCSPQKAVRSFCSTLLL